MKVVPSVRTLELLTTSLQNTASAFHRTQNKVTGLEARLMDFEMREEEARSNGKTVLQRTWGLRVAVTHSLIQVYLQYLCLKREEYAVIKRDMEERLNRLVRMTGGQPLEEIPEIEDMDEQWSFHNLC